MAFGDGGCIENTPPFQDHLASDNSIAIPILPRWAIGGPVPFDFSKLLSGLGSQRHSNVLHGLSFGLVLMVGATVVVGMSQPKSWPTQGFFGAMSLTLLTYLVIFLRLAISNLDAPRTRST